MNRVALRQVGAVIGLEWRKTFLSRRGWWVYLVALAPVFLDLMHTLVSGRFRFRGHSVFQDSQMFAGEFETYFLHLGIFFGCMGIFSNLFRGEMLEKTLLFPDAGAARTAGDRKVSLRPHRGTGVVCAQRRAVILADGKAPGRRMVRIPAAWRRARTNGRVRARDGAWVYRLWRCVSRRRTIRA